MAELAYIVDGMSCNHCKTAVTKQVSDVSGVSSVDVDLDTKVVRVTGGNLDDASIRAAIDEAGYDSRAA